MDDVGPAQLDDDLWLGVLDGPDGPTLQAAFAADRYLRAEVEAALQEWRPPWMRILLISHFVRSLRENPGEPPIKSFGPALIASMFERMRRHERKRRGRQTSQEP